ncbi:MAG: GAF domain-containing protein [Proteobacteria bacterium]|nr:GAF domain-containing protein [Pseudomonadota bacterium]
MNWSEIVDNAQSLLEGECDPIANAANLSAVLYHALEAVNWVGFYFLKGQNLVLGPFQGQPACVRIPLGKGVCGKAAMEKQSLIVADVHKFPGHIACDAASNSEIVIPILKAQNLIGVLDVDSPKFDRFNRTDQIFLEQIVSLYIQSIS